MALAISRARAARTLAACEVGAPSGRACLPHQAPMQLANLPMAATRCENAEPTPPNPPPPPRAAAIGMSRRSRCLVPERGFAWRLPANKPRAAGTPTATPRDRAGPRRADSYVNNLARSRWRGAKTGCRAGLPQSASDSEGSGTQKDERTISSFSFAGCEIDASPGTNMQCSRATSDTRSAIRTQEGESRPRRAAQPPRHAPRHGRAARRHGRAAIAIAWAVAAARCTCGAAHGRAALDGSAVYSAAARRRRPGQ